MAAVEGREGKPARNGHPEQGPVSRHHRQAGRAPARAIDLRRRFWWLARSVGTISRSQECVDACENRSKPPISAGHSLAAAGVVAPRKQCDLAAAVCEQAATVSWQGSVSNPAMSAEHRQAQVQLMVRSSKRIGRQVCWCS